MSLRPRDSWDDGPSYERFMGRWSRRVGRSVLAEFQAPPGARWLDVGCGTGGLTQLIVETTGLREVLALDRSEAYVAFARERIADEHVHFGVADARSLPIETGRFDAAVSGLVINFVPDPIRMATEMNRAVRPGGMAVVYVWDYGGEMQLLRHFWDAAAALDPAAVVLDEGRRFPLCRPEPLADIFRAAEFRDVEVRGIEVPTDFRDFDDYWTPFLGGPGPAPGYVSTLSGPSRAALRERIRNGLPFAADGSIALVARAWAARGFRSG